MVNHLAYADVLVILSPSTKALQKLLDIVLNMAKNTRHYVQSHENGMHVFCPVKGRDLINVPSFFNMHLLRLVTKYK